jgi:hypothetical protein
MHPAPAEGNFCDKHDNALKPKIVQDYNKYMGYTDRCHRMTNSYSISRWTWKWKKKLFSPSQPDNPEQFHSPRLLWCKSTDFRLTLIKDPIQEAGRFPWIQTALRGRPTPLTEKLTRLDFRQNTHWPRAANCVFGGKQTNMDEGQLRDMRYRFVLATMLQDLSYRTIFVKLIHLEKAPNTQT